MGGAKSNVVVDWSRRARMKRKLESFDYDLLQTRITDYTDEGIDEVHTLLKQNKH